MQQCLFKNFYLERDLKDSNSINISDYFLYHNFSPKSNKCAELSGLISCKDNN